MLLFPTGTVAKEKAKAPSINTPIGELCVSVHSPAGILRLDNITGVRTLPSGAVVFASQNKQVEVEVLVIELPLPEPRFGVVHGCEAAVVRLRAMESVGTLSINCRWKHTPTEASFGPESGECLDALTWETSSTCVTIGTQDGEALAARASRGDKMPFRLKSVFSLDTVIYHSDGLAVPIPDLEQGEICQVHFVVAWAPPRIENDVATWLAADQTPEFILKQAGCE